MLSLPLIPPHGDMWYRPDQHQRPRSESPPPSHAQNPHQTHRQRQQRDDDKKQFNAKSPLALLAAEEAAIAQRKAAVRNFGAYWIRPPGVPKTLQAMTEEEAERMEQAELERQERGLLDMQAQQQAEEARQRADEAAMQPGVEGDRDLDDDIPEADATGGDLTFNEDSIMEDSQIEQGEQYAEMTVAELTGIAQDEAELGVEHERDLDDSIPEAGSYQHTDTEVEDSDSESDLGSSFVGRSVRRLAGAPAEGQQMAQPLPAGGLHDRMRTQMSATDALPRSPGILNLSSSVLESSATNSSPVLRTNQAARGRAGARSRGRHD